MLTLREFMDACRISDTTARRWIRLGLVDARKVGRKFLIPKDEVQRILEGKERLLA